MTYIEVSATIFGAASLIVALKVLGIESFLDYLKRRGWKDIYDELNAMNENLETANDRLSHHDTEIARLKGDS